ncbi:hypothetical protein Pla52o_03500 [Novipirellula galeiformis]|uniref:Prenyltransferase and squalene oxidase repeat protein n=2 Tax=Novipirellula galeiformis TaxID=2528004 RepID=A0A5C6CSI4_9BACT|nr:hypothetical protein Pla52o_03500 [Novipirellula galeiformis]
MWPLDVWLVALSSVVLYLIVTRLRFDDPRWLFNASTYAIAVPLIALGMSLALRGLVSHYVQKSIQIGFLFSVFLHLMLLILAVHVVIFSQFFPESVAGVKPERSPIRKTVPEYLFQTPKEEAVTPDWSEPVETETTSRVIPEEMRQLPPVEHSAPQLEMPKPKEPKPRPTQTFLMERQVPSHAQPKPADSPAKLARREQASEKLSSPKSSQPEVPKLNRESMSDSQANPSERPLAKPTPRRSSHSTVPQPSVAPDPMKMPLTPPSQAVAAATRNRSQTLPTVGELGLTSQSRPRTTSQASVTPAGASPAPQSVSVASISQTADQMLSPAEVSHQRSGTTAGAQLSQSTPSDAMSTPSSTPTSASSSNVLRRELSSLMGAPDVQSDGAPQARPERSSRGQRSAFTPAGAPTTPGAMATMAAATDATPNDAVSERAEIGEVRSQRSEASSSIPTPISAMETELGPSLDVMMKESIAGLADRPDSYAGIVPTHDLPEVGELDIVDQPRKRLEVGGPATPVGSKIAAVESFNRRVMRTQGGAAPTPAGFVGPATEEAIELGLAYLASTQKDDGSWSLAGHGENVLLQSDTAATGLCLLSFQGAGYTHKRHQYADTVQRGIEFLIQHQKTNGDLYRSENPISDRNVAFYSHGIAALAMCEAYGMTQDEELKAAAQSSLNYIANTQHTKYGGWRYAAQVSSDTSVSGWMMMALKSGELAGLEIPKDVYKGIDRWLDFAQQSESRPDRYRYNPFASNTPTQRHGRNPTHTMTAVGMLMRMYSGWQRDNEAMQSAADYLLEAPPEMGTRNKPSRDGYYWYYATQVMFHMGGEHWEQWNKHLNPLLLESQVKEGPKAGSWHPMLPVEDRWSPHGGRLYVTTMNLLNLEVYYRHLPIYDDTAE